MQDSILLAAVSWLTPGHLTDRQSFHFIQPVLYISSPLYCWNWNINKYCLMIIASFFLYQEKYMCFSFHLVLYVKYSIIFPWEWYLIQEENKFLYFLFSSTKPAIWNFSTLLYVVLLQDTVDECYCLQHFWQHFLLMHTFLKPLQVKILVQVITIHMNTDYKITCSLW